MCLLGSRVFFPISSPLSPKVVVFWSGFLISIIFWVCSSLNSPRNLTRKLKFLMYIEWESEMCLLGFSTFLGSNSAMPWFEERRCWEVKNAKFAPFSANWYKIKNCTTYPKISPPSQLERVIWCFPLFMTSKSAVPCTFSRCPRCAFWRSRLFIPILPPPPPPAQS